MTSTHVRQPCKLLMALLAFSVMWPAGFGLLPPMPVAPVAAAIPGSNGRLAFASNRPSSGDPGDDSEIYTMAPNGSDIQQLTDNAALDFAPSWSPDGSRLVFVSTRNGGRQIFTMRADGAQQTNISNSAASDIEPSWSPDGTKIAFASNRDGAWGIFTMDANGANATRLTNNGSRQDYDPDWSPDSAQIIFARTGATQIDIYRVQANGSAPVNLSNSSTSEGDPAWSPDGFQIVFTRQFPGTGSATGEIMTMNADGANPTNLTNDPSDDLWPAWQALPRVPPIVKGPPKFTRGSDIVFSSNRVTPANPEGDFEIFTLTLNVLSGETLTQVTFNAVDDLAPAWSPDGARIAFERNANIHVMNADGSGQVNLTSNPVSVHGPRWSPDGSRIVYYGAVTATNTDLFTMDANGSNQAPLTNTPNTTEYRPDWSPDGSQIVFVNTVLGATAISVMNVDGSNRRTLIDLPLIEDNPQWSPDGQRIAFDGNSDTQSLQTDIFTVRADGSNLANRTTSPQDYEQDPAWSPDGRQIVYAVRTRSNANTELFTMKTNGTSRTKRTNNPAMDGGADWTANPGSPAAPLASNANGQHRQPGRGDRDQQKETHKSRHKAKQKQKHRQRGARGRHGPDHGGSNRRGRDTPRNERLRDEGRNWRR